MKNRGALALFCTILVLGFLTCGPDAFGASSFIRHTPTNEAIEPTSWSFFAYHGGQLGVQINGRIFLPYPIISTGGLAGSDAQPYPDSPMNLSLGFGFNATFIGGGNDSSNFGDNMAVWLHSNESNYNYPEYGFTYRPATGYIYGYYQWGNGSPSSIKESTFPLMKNDNASHIFSLRVNSVKHLKWWNTFSWFIGGRLFARVTYRSYFDYATPMYIHAATHMYSPSNACGGCSLGVGGFYQLVVAT